MSEVLRYKGYPCNWEKSQANYIVHMLSVLWLLCRNVKSFTLIKIKTLKLSNIFFCCKLKSYLQHNKQQAYGWFTSFLKRLQINQWMINTNNLSCLQNRYYVNSKKGLVNFITSPFLFITIQIFRKFSIYTLCDSVMLTVYYNTI